jgi:hypothetical protein
MEASAKQVLALILSHFRQCGPAIAHIRDKRTRAHPPPFRQQIAYAPRPSIANVYRVDNQTALESKRAILHQKRWAAAGCWLCQDRRA